MAVSQEPAFQWQRRDRIRPKKSQSSPALRRHYSLQYSKTASADAAALGPREIGTGLVVNHLTRSLPFSYAPPGTHPHRKSYCLQSSTASFHNISTIGLTKGDCLEIQTSNLDPGRAAAANRRPQSAIISAASASESAASLPLSSPTQGIAIRHEYVLEMSKKSKRQSKSMRLSVGGSGGGGMDIMDSLVSSIDEIESKQMRGLPFANGHHRQSSEDFETIISVSPAPVIQTSKSSTRSPSSQNKLRRPSARNSAREANGRHHLRVSPSQDWLPPMEVDEDTFYNVRHSYSSTTSSRHQPQIPARSTSITHEIHPPQIPQRANSLLHVNSVPIPTSTSRRTSKPVPSPPKSEIPSYITRYLQNRRDSSENLAVEQQPRTPTSPRRPNGISRAHSPRLRNSTTAIPGNDPLRMKVVTKRQSSQGFERDLSATRNFYSLPSPNTAAPRRSASLQPSRRSSIISDRSNSLSRVDNNYVDEVLSNPKLTQRIRLTNGRILSFSEVVAFF